MAEEREQQDMTGALFTNDQKTKPGQPDYRGNIIINGVKYWLAGWKKQAKGSGKNFMSLKAEPVDGPRDNQRSQPAGRRDEYEDQRDEQDDFFNS